MFPSALMLDVHPGISPEITHPTLEGVDTGVMTFPTFSFSFLTALTTLETLDDEVKVFPPAVCI